jgi:hypothetical protein
MECSICYKSVNTYNFNCSTPNCNCILCDDCKFKLSSNGKSIDEITENELRAINIKFVCPYCKCIDWKDYMESVFQELQLKVLGEELYYEIMFKKTFPENDDFDFSSLFR